VIISYPIQGIDSVQEQSTFGWIITFYILDFIITLIAFYYVRNEPQNPRRFKSLFIAYIFAGLISRLLVSGVASGAVLDTTIFVTPITAALSSLIFILLLLLLRNSKVGAGVNTELTTLILFNSVGLLFLSGIPTAIILIFSEIELAQFGFAIGGIIKTLSYLIAAFVYYRWSSSMDYYDLAVTTDLTWPEQQKIATETK
jgi:hypothetical protein